MIETTNYMYCHYQHVLLHLKTLKAPKYGLIRQPTGTTNKEQSALRSDIVSPGLDRQLGVKNAGRNTKLLQKQFEPVAPLHCSHKHQRLALNQPQPQQRVDEQELVLLLTFDAVLLQLAAVWQLRALKLEDDLREHGFKCEDKARSNYSY